MEHHYLAVSRELNVKLYSIPFPCRKLESEKRVFGHGLSVKTSVRVIAEQSLILAFFCARADDHEEIDE